MPRYQMRMDFDRKEREARAEKKRATSREPKYAELTATPSEKLSDAIKKPKLATSKHQAGSTAWKKIPPEECEWERVQRMRIEEDSRILGGKTSN